jgi:hypothetical protein
LTNNITEVNVIFWGLNVMRKIYQIKVFDSTAESEINNYLSNNNHTNIITTSDKIIVVTVQEVE